ncbi:MAG: hypothetical protein A2Y62_18175 [Candidatus Fischerbacteria bacterium RBG_13_37_8]|uniref:prephenate dehydratase n=1 Tax=Candidatus Fischerbacteria bacterium RBG_13_37_8 TaxID=1817863 RepID=A0A1F5VVL0_9BACT|nr:MAG: hypothetical protein A2Y62_18175 [Candidatus Fischerbacteria bacterium RBG_13_37_8]
MKIAYWGIPGSHILEAINTHYPDHEYISCRGFTELRYTCLSDEADAVFLAVDDTIGSSIKKAYILMEENIFQISTEINHPICHCLLAIPGVAIEKIQTVLASPETLIQCKSIIEKIGWEAVEYWGDAESARAIAEEKMTSTAAIASRKCADIYKLSVLKEDIGNIKKNIIRYLMLEKNQNEEEVHKITFAFRLPHIQGSLTEFLGIIASHGLNLTKIESMQIPEEPYHYEFFAELEVREKRWRLCIEELKMKAEKLKMLGAYIIK